MRTSCIVQKETRNGRGELELKNPKKDKNTLKDVYPIGYTIDEEGQTPEGATFPSQRYVEDLRNWCGDHEV